MSSPVKPAAPALRERLFVALQYVLPQHLISRLVHRLARMRIGWLKTPFTRWFIRHFGVRLEEAVEPDYRAYPDFNSFFTRALKPEARPVDPASEAVVSPVDGQVSQAGRIEGDAVFQAKGHRFSVHTLLGETRRWSDVFRGGVFTTLYLSPRDYHRIHMPLTGTLQETIHVPGRLFSVNEATTRQVPGLFARNERVVCVFDTAAGPMAMVLVGALNVGSIETVWQGEITPPTGRTIRHWDQIHLNLTLEKGQEMGRFNMGSTVILLFADERVRWEANLQPDHSVKMGQRIGTVVSMEDGDRRHGERVGTATL